MGSESHCARCLWENKDIKDEQHHRLPPLVGGRSHLLCWALQGQGLALWGQGLVLCGLHSFGQVLLLCQVSGFLLTLHSLPSLRALTLWRAYCAISSLHFKVVCLLPPTYVFPPFYGFPVHIPCCPPGMWVKFTDHTGGSAFPAPPLCTRFFRGCDSCLPPPSCTEVTNDHCSAAPKRGTQQPPLCGSSPVCPPFGQYVMLGLSWDPSELGPMYASHAHRPGAELPASLHVRGDTASSGDGLH
mmetsp:Transcript_68806/g.121533  ORF Transcript_68806/g.121533 Transcript_68806/m.121533 type:complete len:243 (-) Transcript_68806:189-917(-)